MGCDVLTAVLKAHRLKNTATFGKQKLYLRLAAGAVVKTSDVHEGEVAFNN